MPNLKMAHSALAGVAAVLDKTPAKENPEYDEILNNLKFIAEHPRMEDERGCLFTVTTIARSDRYGGTRTPAICMTFDRAHEIVDTNEGDIWEYSYMLCVVEAVIPDRLYGSTGAPQFWYAWDESAEKYRPIEVPEPYKNRFGYGIG